MKIKSILAGLVLALTSAASAGSLYFKINKDYCENAIKNSSYKDQFGDFTGVSVSFYLKIAVGRLESGR